MAFGVALLGSLLGVSVGCRMCGSTYDYCGPTYTGDAWDPAGDPMYRANSILSPTNGEGIGLFAGDDCIDCKKGAAATPTMPMKLGAGGPAKPGFSTKTQGGGSRIAVPSVAPNGSAPGFGEIMDESTDPNEYTVPPGNLNWQSPDSKPQPEPLQPEPLQPEPLQPEPVRPNTPSTPFRPGMTQSDPYGNLSESEDFSISLEELRKEDPSIMNVRILGVEEQSPTVNVAGTPHH